MLLHGRSRGSGGAGVALSLPGIPEAMELLRRYRRFPRRRPLLPGIPEVMVALSLPGIPEVTALAGGRIEGRLCRIGLDSRGADAGVGVARAENHMHGSYRLAICPSPHLKLAHSLMRAGSGYIGLEGGG